MISLAWILFLYVGYIRIGTTQNQEGYQKEKRGPDSDQIFQGLIGGVIGCVLLLLLIVIAIAVLCWRLKKYNEKKKRKRHAYPFQNGRNDGQRPGNNIRNPRQEHHAAMARVPPTATRSYNQRHRGGNKDQQTPLNERPRRRPDSENLPPWIEILRIDNPRRRHDRENLPPGINNSRIDNQRISEDMHERENGIPSVFPTSVHAIPVVSERTSITGRNETQELEQQITGEATIQTGEQNQKLTAKTREPTIYIGEQKQEPTIQTGQQNQQPAAQTGEQNQEPTIHTGEKNNELNIETGEQNQKPTIETGEQSQEPSIQEPMPSDTDSYLQDTSNSQRDVKCGLDRKQNYDNIMLRPKESDSLRSNEPKEGKFISVVYNYSPT